MEEAARSVLNDRWQWPHWTISNAMLGVVGKDEENEVPEVVRFWLRLFFMAGPAACDAIMVESTCKCFTDI